MDAARAQLVDIGRDRVAVRQQGSGPPMVLLHGNPTSGYLWRHVMTTLAQAWTCVAVDLPGFGASSTPGQPLGVVKHGERLDALLDRLDLIGAPIVGHDWAVSWLWTMRPVIRNDAPGWRSASAI
jgi:haloalkane dehalogenase